MQDPREDEPSSSLGAEDRALMESMREISSRAVSTEPVFTKIEPAGGGQDESDEEQVRRALRELGYI